MEDFERMDQREFWTREEILHEIQGLRIQSSASTVDNTQQIMELHQFLDQDYSRYGVRNHTSESSGRSSEDDRDYVRQLILEENNT